MAARSEAGMSSDIARASTSFFVVALLLALLAAWSFFSPLAMQTHSPWQETLARFFAHIAPVLPPLIVAIALRYSQVWAWYVGVLFMGAMFALGVFLSIELLMYVLHGRWVPPVYLILSIAAIPSLFFLFRGRMKVLHELRAAAA